MSRNDLGAAISAHLPDLARRKLRPVDVAVIDSGLDASHPDLAGRVDLAYHVKMVGGVARLLPISRRSNQDSYGHGTAVASIITRIAPNARLIDVHVLEVGNIGSPEALLRGLEAAVDNRWPVVNMSLATTQAVARRLMPLCERAYFQGQVLVAARRNVPFPDDGYPAAFSSVLGVDSDEIPAPYRYLFKSGSIEWHASGEWVSVAAAGGGYTAKIGTSFATPVITGVCALLLGAFPDLAPFELKAVLKAHAAMERPPAGADGRRRAGHGKSAGRVRMVGVGRGESHD
jgi:subtilisin family serine protease